MNLTNGKCEYLWLANKWAHNRRMVIILLSNAHGRRKKQDLS